MNKKTKVLLGLFGAVALSMVAGGSVYAATQTSTKAETFLERVAEVAGIDSQKLKDSFKQISKEDVDQKVADGIFTKEQADEIKAKIDAGEYRFGMGGPKGVRMGIMRADIEAVAEFLGLTKDELMQKHQEEKSLLDISKEQGKTEEQLKTFLSQKFDENLKQAVTDGKLTQERTDEMTTKKDEIVTNIMNHTGFKGPKGDFIKMRD